MKQYVLGFAFSKDKQTIVLIEKQKPDWQKGKLNGVGGKLEKTDATAYHAMMREFEEETGVETFHDQWDCFGSMTFINDIMGGMAKVWLFKLFDDIIYDCTTNEEEIVFTYGTKTLISLGYKNCMHNLPILIPIALSEEFNYTELKG